MGQNVDTGKAGNNFGHHMAVYAAKHLRTKLLDTGNKSNEAILDGKRVVLKSAHKNTSSIGVTLNVLANVQNIVAVLEDKGKQMDGMHHYTIYRVPTEWYKQHMVPSRSSPSAAKTTRMVNCSMIRQHGEAIGRFTCDF